MSDANRIDALVQAYLDDMALAGEIAELAELIKNDPAAADAFARATRFESLLQTHLIEERRAGDWAEPAKPVQPLQSPWRFRHPAAIGAALLAVAAVVLLAIRWWPAEVAVAASGHRVLNGRVLVDGIETNVFADGATLEVLGEVNAAIRLADGNDFELTPTTNAVIRADAGEAIVAMQSGRGKFHGGGAKRPLRVDTPLGAVSGRAADFAVDLEPTTEDEEAVVGPVDFPAFLIVAVLTGQVEVREADEKVKVSAGESRAFAQEKIPTFNGRVVAVSADGQTVTIEGKSGKPGLPSPRRDVSISPRTELAYHGTEQGGDRPTVGMRVTAVLDKTSPDMAAAMEFGEKVPTVSGTVTQVSEDGRTLSIEVYRKGDSPLARTIAIDERTRMTYVGIESIAARPTIGYPASIWLAKDTDRALEIRFVVKTKGQTPKDSTADPKLDTPKKSPSSSKPSAKSGTQSTKPMKKATKDGNSATDDKPMKPIPKFNPKAKDS